MADSTLLIRQQVKYWVLVALLVNALPLFRPLLNESDSVLYALFSQQMVQTGNWNDLMLDGQDWLDKPHFPFWLGALSFSWLGVSVFAYMLPGFLCHLLGAFYTHRLARQWLDRDAAWMSVLVYASVYHLMYTTTALKAEAFLTGSIMGAVYHWWRFDANNRVKHLCLGAVFTGMAVMTKGVFTLVTIGSGLVAVWLYQRRWREWLRPKWWLALGLSAVCVLPELIALYRQFDMHPEKLVFGRTGVSGILFFLWDSQFGRFFNTGPITNQDGHVLYFVAVFLWAFLPWVATFGASLWQRWRAWRQASAVDRTQTVHLLASFGVSFAMFSLASFQLDYYTVIVYPFAAILCAPWLKQVAVNTHHRLGQSLQLAMAAFTALLATWVVVKVGDVGLYGFSAVVLAFTLGWVWHQRHLAKVAWVLSLPVISVLFFFIVIEIITLMGQMRISLTYNALPWLNTEPNWPVVSYQLDPPVSYEWSLLRQSAPSLRISTVQELPKGKDYFLVLKTEALPQFETLKPHLQHVITAPWVDHKTGDLPRLIRMASGTEPLESFSVYRVHRP